MLLCAFLGCQTAPGTEQTTGEPVEDRSPEGLFDSHCTSCHADGAPTEQTPEIRNPVRPWASYVIRNGHDSAVFEASMPAFGDDLLSDAEVDSLIDLLRAAPRPANGAGLYDRMCFNCHGENGAGGRINESISGDDIGEIEEAVRDGHRSNNPADAEYMPAFGDDDLTDDELGLIADFLGAGAGEEEEESDDD
jgi:mono/diheme cytochrome c family protein